jgi:hypothetical protein
MYPDWLSEWLSIDNDVLWGGILLIGHLITTTLALAIFSSIFRENRKKGYIFFVLLICMGAVTLFNVFTYSIAVGFLLCLMYLSLGIITYFSLKNAITNKSSR